MKVSRQKLALMAVFAIAGTMTIMSQRHPAVGMIRAEQKELGHQTLVLPTSDKAIGAWTLTLQLVTAAANLMEGHQGINKDLLKQELGKVVSQAASSHGLRLVDLSPLEQPRRTSRLLLGGTSKSTTSNLLLVGSAVDEEEELDDLESLEEGITRATGSMPQSISLYMRAIIASSLPSESSVAALVRMRGEVVAWTQHLAAAGLPVSSIQVVSLAPHAPTSIEEKLQAQLMLVQQELGNGKSGDHKWEESVVVDTQSFPSRIQQEGEEDHALGAFLWRNIHFIGISAGLVAGTFGLLMSSARKKERVPSSANLATC